MPGASRLAPLPNVVPEPENTEGGDAEGEPLTGGESVVEPAL